MQQHAFSWLLLCNTVSALVAPKGRFHATCDPPNTVAECISEMTCNDVHRRIGQHHSRPLSGWVTLASAIQPCPLPFQTLDILPATPSTEARAAWHPSEPPCTPPCASSNPFAGTACRSTLPPCVPHTTAASAAHPMQPRTSRMPSPPPRLLYRPPQLLLPPSRPWP